MPVVPAKVKDVPALAITVEPASVPPMKIGAPAGVATEAEAVPVSATNADAAPLFAAKVDTAPATGTDVAPVLATKVNAAPVLATKAEAAPVSATKARSMDGKRPAKASNVTGSSRVINPQDVSFASQAGVPPIASPVVVPAAPRGNAQPKPTAENTRPTSSISPLPKPEPPSTGLDLDQPAPAQLPSAPAGLTSASASASAKQVSFATAVQSKAPHGMASVVAAAGANAASVPGVPAVASPTAGLSHANQAAALNAAVETSAPILPTSSSARADLQFHPTNGVDTTGIGQVHILPSAPTQLEVGVLDGTHGWLRIRAELGTSGAVSASLTANPLAHESLNAALPEMVKYLGSEGVSVSSVAVHRYAEDANVTSGSTPESQMNANPQGHRSGGDEQRDGSGTQQNPSQASDPSSAAFTSVDTSAWAGTNADDIEIPGASTQGFSRAAPGIFSPLGVSGGSSGNWLNVSA